MKLINLINKRFGKLKVLSYLGGSRWLCKCDCGNEKSVLMGHLRDGEIKSCGCLKRENLIREKYRNGSLKAWTKPEIKGKYVKIHNSPKTRKKHKDIIKNFWETCDYEKQCYKMKEGFVKHHIYLKENGRETILVKGAKKHKQIHAKVLEYLFDKGGKAEVDLYMVWFEKRYGL